MRMNMFIFLTVLMVLFCIPSHATTITYPTNNSTVCAGSFINITWNRSTSYSDVQINISLDTSEPYDQIIYASNTGSYPLYIPPDAGEVADISIIEGAMPLRSGGDFSPNRLASAHVFFNVAQQSITINSPNEGDTFCSGSSVPISWASQCNQAGVKVEYSLNDGSTWQTLIASGSSSGNTSLNLAGVTSSRGLIRTKIHLSSVFDQKTFNITPQSLNVTYPNGGESLCAGYKETITWDSQCIGNTENVSIEFHNGSSWQTIVDSTPNTGSYSNWTVPNTPSTQCKIRISDASNLSIVSECGNFEIKAKSITISSPNGESYCSGETIPISWASQCVSNVKIEIAPVNTSNWQLIATTASSSYNWAPSNLTPGIYIVRVTDATGTVSDQKQFTVLAKNISIISPNGGESFCAGENIPIYWTSQCIQNVRIEYSTNNGATWQIVTSSTSNTGTYVWTVPNTPSTLCKIKIIDVSNANTLDLTDSNFEIIGSSITLIYPNGGELSCATSPPPITWVSSGCIQNVKIEYTINNGLTWQSIASSAPNIGHYYLWDVPSTPSVQCKIRVSDTANTNTFDASDGTFEIKAHSVTLASPNGGESFCVGDTVPITWTSNCIANVKIEYSTNNGSTWESIGSDNTTSPVNNGSYLWKIPNMPSKQCKIRLTGGIYGEVSDMSDSVFEIKTPSISITSPGSGESFLSGDSVYIAWQSQCVTNVKVQYAPYSSSIWQTIISSTSSPGSIYWDIPTYLSGTYKLRVVDLSNSIILNSVTIDIETPQINVTSPNGSETLCVGSTHIIRWNSQYISYVDIYYTTNGGSTWQIVASNVPNNNSYDWAVPNTPSTQCRIKVSDASNSSVTDISNSNFEIKTPSITVGTPNGGETFCVGSQQSITWTSTTQCVSANVKIEYTTDNLSWITIIASTPNTGSYTWLVSNTPSTQCKVRISDVSNGTITDVSNSPFEIKTPSITVGTPNGSETFTIGDHKTITWTSTAPCVSNVKIEYTIDNGTSWQTIIASTPNSGTYTWNVPDTVSTLCKIKISSASDSNISDISDGTFSIKPAISVTVLSPNGNEKWEAGTIHPITWTSNGITGNIRIDYTTDNGASSWTAIEYSLPNTGSYNWTVPNTISTQCKIRLSSVTNTTITDDSDNTFTIYEASTSANRQALITLYNSTNGDNWTHNSGWKTPPLHADGFAMPGTENSWYGINLGSNSIYQINLQNNNLTGTIPDNIFENVSGIHYLYLNGNHLSGNIPSTIGKQTLEDLKLNNNAFTGSIPDTFNTMSNVLYIDLSWNQLSGQLPNLSGLSQCVSLNVSRNTLSGSIPDWIGYLSQLVYLDLSNNQFSGNIPSSIGLLSNLKQLSIHHNQLTGTIPDSIGNLSKLNVLYLHNNSLGGNLPTTLGNLINLTNLHLNANMFKGMIPDSFLNLVNLTTDTSLDYNALYTNNAALVTFLNSKDSDWQSTQTVAPSPITVQATTGNSVTLSWTPITFRYANGGYQVFYSTTAGGPYTLFGITADKNATSMTVTGLNPSTTYYFIVKTKTLAYWNNANDVVSEKSSEVSAITAPF